MIISIVNIYIKIFIQFLKLFNINLDAIIEIQANEFNIGVKINNLDKSIDILILIDYLKSYNNMYYIEINDIVISNKLFIDTIGLHIIKRQFVTFHQNDDIVKEHLYKLIKHDTVDNLILIGGEMYGYHNVIKSNNLFCYSDFDSVVNDTIYNVHPSIYKICNIIKINYDLYKFTDYDGISCMICNNGKGGLGKNITKQIITLNINTIYIVSCNENSLKTDYNVLKNKYNIVEKYHINNVILLWLILNIV